MIVAVSQVSSSQRSDKASRTIFPRSSSKPLLGVEGHRLKLPLMAEVVKYFDYKIPRVGFTKNELRLSSKDVGAIPSLNSMTGSCRTSLGGRRGALTTNTKLRCRFLGR